VEIRVLGPLEVHGPAGLIRISSARRRAVLGVLAMHAGEVVSRDRLVGEVWGPEPPDTADHALEVHISALRSTLGREVIETRPPGYVLRASVKPVDLAQFESDAREATAALDAGDPARAATLFQAALGLWRGAALEDLASTAVATAERARLDTLRETITDRWLDAELALGHHLEVLPELRRAVADDPLREGLHERLAVALYRSGRQAEALEAYHAARRLLDEELGVEPGPQLQQLERAILQHDPALAAPAGDASATGTAARQPAVSTSDDGVRARDLPARATSFIGRDDALRDIGRLLESNRVVTLTGPGGVGKTSLAIELARHRSAQFTDGAWFVPLDAVHDPNAVLLAVIARLGLRDIPAGMERQRLLDNLAVRHLLLVLDNMEHVVDAASLVRDIAAAAPRVQIVVTSRVPLLLTAEQLYPVRPLALSDDEHTDEPRNLDSVAAIRLFVDRARAREPTFELTPTNASVVLDICRLVDGLPLGIEIAAAQVGLLGTDGVRDRLARDVPLRGHTMRDQPPRQQTLEAAIGWSHDLLDDASRELLALLSVFAGGARLDQVVAVASTREHDPSLLDVEDALATLVRHSLVVVRHVEPGVRYAMLETVRAFAARQLATDDARTARRRHALAYLEVAENHAASLPGRGQVAILERLSEERDNFATAIRWATDAGEIEIAQRFGAALWRFWQFRGDIGTGRSTVDTILAMRGSDEPTVSRARLLEAAGGLAYWATDLPAVKRFYAEQLELAREIGDERLIADAWFNTSFPPEQRGIELGTHAVDEAATRYRALGDEKALARTLWQRAVLLIASDDVAQGRELLERALERYRELDDVYYLGMSAGYLAGTYFREGDPVTALPWARLWVEVSKELGDIATLVRLLEVAVDVLLGLGRAEDATTMFAAYEAAAIRYGMGSVRTIAPWTVPDPFQRGREALGDDMFNRAVDRGRAMDLTEAVTFLLATLDNLLESARAAPAKLR
jgi:predicted ATPase/DNA-binding SARP family transcriptional activator